MDPMLFWWIGRTWWIWLAFLMTQEFGGSSFFGNLLDQCHFLPLHLVALCGLLFLLGQRFNFQLTREFPESSCHWNHHFCQNKFKKTLFSEDYDLINNRDVPEFATVFQYHVGLRDYMTCNQFHLPRTSSFFCGCFGWVGFAHFV